MERFKGTDAIRATTLTEDWKSGRNLCEFSESSANPPSSPVRQSSSVRFLAAFRDQVEGSAAAGVAF